MVATSLTFLLFLALCYGAWAQPPPYCTPFVQGISLGFAGSGIPVQNKAGSSTTYHFMLKVNTNIIVNASDWIVYAGIFTYRSILSQQFGYNMGTQNLNALQLPFGPVKNTSYSYRFDVTNNSVGVYYAAASITIAKPDFSMVSYPIFLQALSRSFVSLPFTRFLSFPAGSKVLSLPCLFLCPLSPPPPPDTH